MNRHGIFVSSYLPYQAVDGILISLATTAITSAEQDTTEDWSAHHPVPLRAAAITLLVR